MTDLAAERRAIAKRLHDGPVQELTAALLYLDLAAADAPSDRVLAKGLAAVRAAVDSTRALLDDLDPEPR